MTIEGMPSRAMGKVVPAAPGTRLFASTPTTGPCMPPDMPAMPWPSTSATFSSRVMAWITSRTGETPRRGVASSAAAGVVICREAASTRADAVREQEGFDGMAVS